MKKIENPFLKILFLALIVLGIYLMAKQPTALPNGISSPQLSKKELYGGLALMVIGIGGLAFVSYDILGV